MLYSVSFLGFFSIIEPVESTNQITSDAPDSLEGDALAYNAVFSMQSGNHKSSYLSSRSEECSSGGK